MNTVRIKRFVAGCLAAILGAACADEPNKVIASSHPQHYAETFATLALQCIEQEYSNKISHYLRDDDDVKPPRQLYPAFYGCFDWHSSVHGHWLLVRLLNTHAEVIEPANLIGALNQRLTAENIAGEVRYLQPPERASFERPYGLAWLLQLTAELRQSKLPEAQQWLQHLLPLESLAIERISEWLPKLTHPIRTGEHSQTAFAFGLMLDWSRIAGHQVFFSHLTQHILRLYRDDKNCPLSYEPSGQDFLSPCLAEADLMRRVLNKTDYASWLSTFLPMLHADTDEHWLRPAVVSDKTDGKLAHLDGLNLSRAWMLAGIIAALPQDDARTRPLMVAYQQHRKAGLAAVFGEMHYMGSHWLGTFATYLETQRGLALVP